MNPAEDGPRGPMSHKPKLAARGGVQTGRGASRVAWRGFAYSFIAAELSAITRHMEGTLFVAEEGAASGPLFALLDAPGKRMLDSAREASALLRTSPPHTAVVLPGNLNHEHDIEGVLRELGGGLARAGRFLAVLYNPYLRGVYALANRLGLRRGALPCTYLTFTDLNNLARLAGFEVVRARPAVFLPWRLLGLGTFINRICAGLPGIRQLSLSWVVILRPRRPAAAPPSLSIVIPARNERGNIAAALERMPRLAPSMEIVFVEGHSRDGTWEEILRVAALHQHRFAIRCLRQTGSGKADAVRLGFAEATGDLLTILDADLTMPPELLGRFYEAWCRGDADFINGNRLVYPMEGQAMRFLNWLGNIFFAKALSFVLGTRVGDSLCGTKLVARRDYERMVAWRRAFGDFDPFGDFELLFPACALGLGVIDVPIRYRDRVYGTTNIRRFHHGWMLLRMTLVGLRRLRLGAAPAPRPETT